MDSLVPQIERQFEELELEGINIHANSTHESDQDPLVLEINYPYVTNYTKYVRPRVLAEIGIRSLREPFTPRKIRSVIANEFVDNPYSDDPVIVPTVNPERTFLEKLFLLHEEFQRPKAKVRVDRLSRHLYDIHQIGQTDFADKAIQDQNLYRSIIEHRSVFTRLGGVDYNSHYPPTLNPIPPDHIIALWEKDYAIMLEQMIYGEPVDFNSLISTIKGITEKINGL